MVNELLELDAVTHSVRVLRRTLAERLAELQVDEQQVGDFTLAVCEAFSNAVYHGTASPEERIQACLQFWREQCSVTLVYPGEPFTPQPPALPSIFSTDGRGRYLMSVLTDQVEYEFENGLTRVRLVKRWSAASCD